MAPFGKKGPALSIREVVIGMMSFSRGEDRMMRPTTGGGSLGAGPRGGNLMKNKGLDRNRFIFFFSESFILASELKSRL